MFSQVFFCPRGGLRMMSLPVRLFAPMLLLMGHCPWSHVHSGRSLLGDGGGGGGMSPESEKRRLRLLECFLVLN